MIRSNKQTQRQDCNIYEQYTNNTARNKCCPPVTTAGNALVAKTV